MLNIIVVNRAKEGGNNHLMGLLVRFTYPAIAMPIGINLGTSRTLTRGFTRDVVFFGFPGDVVWRLIGRPVSAWCDFAQRLELGNILT